MIMTLLPLPKILPRNQDQRRADAYRRLLRREAKMGGKLFGALPAGHRREFFCLDERTWVWHEEWLDAQGAQHAATTRYDIRSQGVLKSQGVNSYQLVRGEELHNLYQATQLYVRNLQAELAALQQ
jgi:hypothetical protein